MQEAVEMLRFPSYMEANLLFEDSFSAKAIFSANYTAVLLAANLLAKPDGHPDRMADVVIAC
ncbi:MAG: hypothetical protein KDC80_26570, partial [Saprospiraceae bacterium]|nr:hypothetical protein [Saprospiraceae bacterium]